MKHIKSYENVNKRPEVGDWIIMQHWWAGQHLHKFIDSTPAQIIKIYHVKEYDEHVEYEVLYPSDFGRDDEPWVKFFTTTKGYQNFEHWVKYIAKNKEDLEIYNNAEKYNL